MQNNKIVAELLETEVITAELLSEEKIVATIVP